MARGTERETGRDKDRFKIQDVFADERCSQAVPSFLADAVVGRRTPDPAEGDAQSEVSEWGLRGREEEADRGRGWTVGGGKPACVHRHDLDT